MKTSLMFISCALLLAGCASSQTRQQPTTTQPQTPQPASGLVQPPQAGMTAGEMGGEMGAACPMAVEGTTVRAEDVEGGAAMVFTTTGDVAELRRRVAQMADMHNRHHGEGAMMGMGGGMMGGMQGGMMGGMQGGMKDGGMMGSEGDSGMSSSSMSGSQGDAGMQGGMMQGRMMMMPASTARAEDIAGGARLVLIARDSAQTATLRDNVRQWTQRMASGQCPMMGRH